MPPRQQPIDPEAFLSSLREVAESGDLDLESNDRAVLKLNRNNLVLLAKHLNVPMKESALKGCIQTSVILALSELDYVSENLVQSLEKSPNVTLTEASFEGEPLPVPTPHSLEAIAVKEREATVRLELQFKLEEKKLQQEQELKMKRLESKSKSLKW